MKSTTLWTLVVVVFSTSVCVAHAGPTYTSDGNLSDFTNVTYGTFIVAPFGDNGNQTVPYTPTTADVNNGVRVYASGVHPVLIVQFNNPVSSIRVFPNIDHFGSFFDGYQYTVLGSNDGVNFTPLFDATSVTGLGEPFTLGTWTGTAPTTVNNLLTPGAGIGGTVGYIADFTFSQAYTYYEFGPSTVGIDSGNTEQELTAVAAATPEPATIALLGIGIVGMAGYGWRRQNKEAVAC